MTKIVGTPDWDKLLKRLKENDATLTELSLYCKELEDSGAQALSEVLKVNRTLKHLDIGGNKIGTSGAQALSEALKINCTLTSLIFHSNVIGDSGAQALSEMLKVNRSLKRLKIDGRQQIGVSGVQALGEALKVNDSLLELELGFDQQFGDTGAQALSEGLTVNRCLTRLLLQYSQIGEKGIQALSGALKNNEVLSELNLQGNVFGDNGAQILSKALKSNHGLTILQLYGNQIKDAGAKDLSQALQVNRTLTYLGLSDNQIGDAGAQAFSETLKGNHILTRLNLSYNQIGDAGVQDLSQALQVNRTLADLGLNKNKIGNTGAQAFSEMLKVNRTLTSLSLYGNQIGDAGAQALSETLTGNHTLTSLSLFNNQIEDVTQKEINMLTQRNCTLRNACYQAVKDNHLEQVMALLDQGVGVVSTRTDGNTLLHEAVQHKHIELVKGLIKWMQAQGISLTIKNIKGQTPLDLAQGDAQLMALFAPSPAPVIKQEENEPTSLTPTVPSKASKEEVKALVQPLVQLSISFAIPYAELSVGQELGRGGFGVVYKGTWRYNPVAIKQLHSHQLSMGAAQEFQQEMQVMSQLRSPNIVQLYGVATDKSPYCLVMEYMDKGSLFNVLHSPATLPWPVRKTIAIDIAKGLAYLHHEKILHRDLKSMNVLLDKHYTAKLTDFGLARVKTEAASTSTNSSKAVGTLAWMAPELFKRKVVYTDKADMYSYGMVLWEIAAREVPFKDAHSAQLIPQWVAEGEREEIPTETPPKLAKLIKFCWEAAPEKRPSAAAIIEQLQVESEVSSTTAPTYQDNLSSNVLSGPAYLSNTNSKR